MPLDFYLTVSLCPTPALSDHTHLAIKVLGISAWQYGVAHPQPHPISLEHPAYVNNRYFCPRVSWKLSTVSTKLPKVSSIRLWLLNVCVWPKFMPDHISEPFSCNRSIYRDFSHYQGWCVYVRAYSPILGTWLSLWPNPQPTDVNLIQPPSKNVHLFLTVQPIFIRTYCPKTT